MAKKIVRDQKADLVAPKRKRAIDTPRMFLLLAKLMNQIVEEMVLATPSHRWDNMLGLQARSQQVVRELEEIVGK
jgi:hypothetical protein